MSARCLTLTLLAALFPVAAMAQNVVSYNGSADSLTMPGLPFHATRVTLSTRKLADGSTQSRNLEETIDRDSAGRVLIVSRVVARGAVPIPHPTSSYQLFDPTAAMVYTWTSHSTGATSYALDPKAVVTVTPAPLGAPPDLTAPKDSPDNQYFHEDLDKRNVGGMPATGTRNTVNVPVGRFDNNKLMAFVQETWYSPDLHVNLLEIHTDPLTGTRSSELTAIKRGEPPATLFHVPDGVPVTHATGQSFASEP